MQDINKLISLQLEKNALGGLIRNPEVFTEVEPFITPEVFADQDNIHSVIYSVARNILSAGKTDKLDKVILAQEISNLGIRFKSEINIFDYISAISFTQITKPATVESFKQLLKLKLCRDIYWQSQKVQQYIVENASKSIDKIVEEVDGLNNEKINAFASTSSAVKDIFADLEPTIRNIAANPPNDKAFLMGPFPTINRMYGSLSKPGNITVIAARSSVGKSSLAMFYNVFLADKYDLPVLHLDNGEMSEEELIFRAACMFTKGKISIHALEHGTWNRDIANKKIMEEAFARAKKIKFYYKNVAGLKPNEVISFIRRFSLNKVGRDNQFLTDYDYLKPFDTVDYNVPEWKQMGHFIQDLKSFITNELKIAIWTSLQQNKYGITTGKTSGQIQEDEGTFGISDKILQQSSHAIILRPKVTDEIAKHGHDFGNMVAKFVKHRHLGEDYQNALSPVQTTKGKYEKNYVNLQSSTFWFEDKGDLRTMVSLLKEKYDVQEEEDKKDKKDDASL